MGREFSVDVFEALGGGFGFRQPDFAHGFADDLRLAAGVAGFHYPVACNLRPAIDTENPHGGQFTAVERTSYSRNNWA